MSRSVPVPRRTIALLALAGAATVANLYYSQPLLATIAATYHVTSTAVSVIATATQLGYATGLLLLVPLGDTFPRRRLIVIMTAVVVVTLLAVAASQSIVQLIAASFFLGAATIVPQLVVPFAANLAPREQRGSVIGAVMSGLLVGIILSRTISGVVGAYVGWRVTYLFAAAAMAILAVVLQFGLDEQEPEHAMRYRDLLRSVVHLLRTERVLQRHALVGAFGFAAFSVFWTVLAFHLRHLSPSYGSQVVGAFGIIGVSGALAAPVAGRFADRVDARFINGSALLLIVLAYALMGLFRGSLVVLGIGAILLDAGSQSSHISNQTRIFGLDSALRNRLNAGYMVLYFAGGATGSAVAGLAWHEGGWPAVCGAGATFALCAIVALFAIRVTDVRGEPRRGSER